MKPRPSQLKLALVLSIAACTLCRASSAMQTAAVGTAAPGKSAPPLKSQMQLANPKVVFATLVGKDAKVAAATEAHNLAGAKALIGKAGALVGTVAGVYEPKGNKLIILNFDPDYKTAVSAIIYAENFSKFPDLHSLIGKKALVSGKFTAFHNGAELVVAHPDQIILIK